MQHFESAELTGFGTLRVTAQLHGFRLSSLSIIAKQESPYVVYLPEGRIYFHDILLYLDAAARLTVDKAISEV